jgi:hypothetical protein
MLRLQSGAGPVDEDGSDIDVAYTDSDGDAKSENQDDELIGSDEEARLG